MGIGRRVSKLEAVLDPKALARAEEDAVNQEALTRMTDEDLMRWRDLMKRRIDAWPDYEFSEEDLEVWRVVRRLREEVRQEAELA